MSEYPLGSQEDRKTLTEMPMEKLFDYFFLQIRNIWRVDGLYFLGIEKKFGTEAATEIDAQVLGEHGYNRGQEFATSVQGCREPGRSNDYSSPAQIQLGTRSTLQDQSLYFCAYLEARPQV